MRKLSILILILSSIQSYSQQVAGYSNIQWYAVHASVRHLNDGAAAPGINSFLSIPGRHFQLATAVSDSNGNIAFLIKKPKGSFRLIIQANDPTVRIVINAEDSLLRAFHLDSNKLATPHFTDTVPFYGAPDKSYVLDDYTRFPTFEEIMIEYIPEVKIRKLKGKFFLEVFNKPYQKFFTEPPLILLDGIPLLDVDKLLALDPLQTKKIDVVTRKYFFGRQIWNGIVSLSTYKSDGGGYRLPAGAIVIER